MADEKDVLPSDAENGSLKPQPPKNDEAETPPPETQKPKDPAK